MYRFSTCVCSISLFLVCNIWTNYMFCLSSTCHVLPFRKFLINVSTFVLLISQGQLFVLFTKTGGSKEGHLLLYEIRDPMISSERFWVVIIKALSSLANSWRLIRQPSLWPLSYVIFSRTKWFLTNFLLYFFSLEFILSV